MLRTLEAFIIHLTSRPVGRKTVGTINLDQKGE